MGIPMNHMQNGQSGRILELATQGGLRQRLFDLGLTPGTMVERLMSSPIGDPSCYRVRGAMIALRGSDAEQIRVAV
jgi:ferrous iron transport protein A